MSWTFQIMPSTSSRRLWPSRASGARDRPAGAPSGETALVAGFASVGMFQLNNVAPADIEPLLLIECPRYLFPYAREIIARATSDGGFYPPFMMDPLDFTGIYLARQQQISANGQTTGQA